jgi:hypothetical protein
MYIERIEPLIQDIPVASVFWVLEQLDLANDQVFYKSSTIAVRDLVKKDSINWLSAREVAPLWFWGGPPKKLRWYRGTLETFLLDRLLDFVTHESVEELLIRLGFDTSSTKCLALDASTT